MERLGYEEPAFGVHPKHPSPAVCQVDVGVFSRAEPKLAVIVSGCLLYPRKVDEGCMVALFGLV